MMSFEREIVISTVEKLLNGEDYREEVVNAINVTFLDFMINFFKKIVEAKMNSNDIDLSWYKDNFINDKDLPSEERVIFAGMNRKTITNIYGSSRKKTYDRCCK